MLPSVGNKNPQIPLSRGVVLSQSTFHLVATDFVTEGCLACKETRAMYPQFIFGNK